jgi:hypothetical protein
LAAPYSGFPDERDHIMRAAGVVTGQIALEPEVAANGSGAFVTVPRSLLVDQCWQFHPEVAASCAAEPGGDETKVRAATSAGRYFPAYYAIVGAPLALWPDWTGVLLARLISAALCAALLAVALTDALRWSRHRLMAVGVVAAATPMVAHMGGAVNPSGIELAAGIAFFAAVVPLLYHSDAQRESALLRHAGLAALVLATLRVLGPLWLVLSAGALLLAVPRATLRRLWTWRAMRWWCAGIGAAMAAGLAWSMLSGVTQTNPYFSAGEELSAAQIVWAEFRRWPQYLDEMVGITSWLDATMPELAYLLWQVTSGAVVVWGFLLAGRAGRVRIAALAVATILVPTVGAVMFVNAFGFVTQGRYILPLLVGLPIYAAYLLGEYGIPADKARDLTRLVLIVLLPIHLVCLAFTMIRWQSGLVTGGGFEGLNPLGGPWHPPLGSPAPLLACVVGLLLLGWLVWTGGPRPGASDERLARDGVLQPATRPATMSRDDLNLAVQA